jgi:hypothetical protein
MNVIHALEAEISRLKQKLNDRNRHISGAYDALGDVNRSIYLFDPMERLRRALATKGAKMRRMRPIWAGSASSGIATGCWSLQSQRRQIRSGGTNKIGDHELDY